LSGARHRWIRENSHLEWGKRHTGSTPVTRHRWIKENSHLEWGKRHAGSTPVTKPDAC
jgi:hypothetical protein